VSFSFDGSYVAAGAEEAEELEIAHVETGEYVASIPLAGPQAGVPKAVTSSFGSAGGDGGAASAPATATPTNGPNNAAAVGAATCVAWHPHRYWLAYSGDPGGLRVVGAGGGGGVL
jgi:THO complex subunit 3